MPKISSGVARPRLPPAYNGIDVNACRNAHCQNFGIPEPGGSAHVAKGRPRIGAAPATHLYRLNSEADEKSIVCYACGQATRVKSNFGIAAEYFRIAKYLLPIPGPTCANTVCTNTAAVFERPDAWRKHGKTRFGSDRYSCKSCGATVSIGRSTLRHRKSHENREIFLALMNGMPLRRIMKTREVSASTLYGKIEFLHEQCLKFAAERERQLEGLPLPAMRIAMDKQDYHVNWLSRKERRPMRFSAVGAADLDSGYVFAANLSYDPDIDTMQATLETIEEGHVEWPPPYRRHARLWLPTDHKKARDISEKLDVADLEKGSLDERISKLYAAFDALEREEFVDWFESLPKKGAQVRLDYVAAAQFNLLAGMLHGSPQVTFYLDLDSELRSAALAIWNARIRSGTADVFFVKIAKEVTIDVKRRLVGEIKRNLERARRMLPHMSDDEIRRGLIIRRIMRMKRLGGYGDLWMKHPIPTMAEPDKRVCHLTDYDDREPRELAPLYDRASLHAIDRFFMQVRRGISVAERPISTANTGRRVWYGKHAYNPLTLKRLLEMYRVVFNYHELGQDRMTPAMRLGLARGRVKLEDIIYL